MNRKLFVTASLLAAVALSTGACSGTSVTANSAPATSATTAMTTVIPEVERRYTPTSTPTTTSASMELYEPTPPPAPKPVKNNLPRYSDDALRFGEATINLLLTQARTDSAYAARVTPRSVRLVRKDQVIECAGLPAQAKAIRGFDTDNPVIWCPGQSANNFYVKAGTLETYGQESSLKATYGAMDAVAVYLLGLDKLSTQAGYRSCMAGYLAGLLETNGVIDAVVAKDQLVQFAGDTATFYLNGYMNGREACRT